MGEGDGNEDGTISDTKPSLRGHSLLPMEGGAPKGRRLDGGSGMKKIGEDRLKYAVCESTLSTAGAVPLPQWGRLRYENTAISFLPHFLDLSILFSCRLRS